MEIQVVTDCTGIKQDAIKGVFQGKFENDFIDLKVQKGISFTTPMTKDDFSLTARKRIQQLRKNYENPAVYFATIQKGYYCENSIWYLSACVAISAPLLAPLPLMASSVPILGKCSKEKELDLNKNMGDIISEVYTDWNKEKDSVYKLFTGEDEKMWLQQPLRHCLYQLLSQRD